MALHGHGFTPNLGELGTGARDFNPSGLNPFAGAQNRRFNEHALNEALRRRRREHNPSIPPNDIKHTIGPGESPFADVEEDSVFSMGGRGLSAARNTFPPGGIEDFGDLFAMPPPLIGG